MNAGNVDMNELLARIEAAGLSGHFHKDWLLQLRGQLRGQLPAAYFVFVETEAVLVSAEGDTSGGTILPDAAIVRPDSIAGTPGRDFSQATAATLEAEETCEEYTQYSLLIRRAPENRVIAALEILSPSNKGLGNKFDEERHLRKHDSLLAAGVNLTEIDALLGGHRLMSTPLAK